MAHIAIVEFRMDPARLEEARAVVADLLETSRTFPGCDHLEWLVDRDDPAHWTLYETWSSWEAEQAYRDFRSGEGTVPELAELLAEPPTLARYETHAG
ncbi:putative quinol monooxygenase [Agromyces bauzanensis]